jgi:hypothetical protein
MLRVNLPTSILLPITADINGLIKILSGGQTLETIHRATDQGTHNEYAGESTYYAQPIAIPEILRFCEPVHATREIAQEEKNLNAAEVNKTS